MVNVEQLLTLNIFKNASRASLDRLSKDMVSKIFLTDDVICKEGDMSSGIFLIASGSVAVKKKVGGSEKVVARLEAEEFFGEMAFLDRGPYSATVTAQEESEILILPRITLNELINKEPAQALDQVITLMSGISSRLRRTTQESVTVFEVARLVGSGHDVKTLVARVLDLLKASLPPAVSIAFFRWNPFNDEYMRIGSTGADVEKFPETVERASGVIKSGAAMKFITDIAKTTSDLSPLAFTHGQLAVSRVDMSGSPEGLFIYYLPSSVGFDGGAKQLIETISAVLAPALSTARAREEEDARRTLQQNKQRFTF